VVFIVHSCSICVIMSLMVPLLRLVLILLLLDGDTVRLGHVQWQYVPRRCIDQSMWLLRASNLHEYFHSTRTTSRVSLR